MKKFILLIIVLVFGFYVGWPAFSGYQINQALKSNDSNALAAKIDFSSVRSSMRGPILAKVDERMAQALKSLGPAAAALGGSIKKDQIAKIVDGALEDVVNPQQVTAIYAKGGDFAGAMQEAVLRQVDKMGGVAALLGGGNAAGAAPAGSDNSGGGALGGLLGGTKLPKGLGGLGAALGGKQAGGLVGDLVGQAGLNSDKLKKMLFPAGRKMSSGGGAAGNGSSSFGLSNIKKFGFAGPLGLQLAVARNAADDAPDITAQMEFTDLDWKVTKLIPNLDKF